MALREVEHILQVTLLTPCKMAVGCTPKSTPSLSFRGDRGCRSPIPGLPPQLMAELIKLTIAHAFVPRMPCPCLSHPSSMEPATEDLRTSEAPRMEAELAGLGPRDSRCHSGGSSSRRVSLNSLPARSKRKLGHPLILLLLLQHSSKLLLVLLEKAVNRCQGFQGLHLHQMLGALHQGVVWRLHISHRPKTFGPRPLRFHT